jgi:mRNA interferase RelE/StbE
MHGEGSAPARRGTYRVIYPIEYKARIVTVVDLTHRRDAYRI